MDGYGRKERKGSDDIRVDYVAHSNDGRYTELVLEWNPRVRQTPMGRHRIHGIRTF